MPHLSADFWPGRWGRWRLALFGALGLLVGAAYVVVSFVPWPRDATIRLPDSRRVASTADFREASAANARGIATVSTCFTRDTWLATDLFAVESGAVIPIGSLTSGRSSSSSRPGDPYLMRFGITFTLANAEYSGEHTTLIKMRGGSRAYGSLGGAHSPIEIIAHRTFPGRLRAGERRLLYVEGDREFTADAAMSVADFARANAGNYVVVTIELER